MARQRPRPLGLFTLLAVFSAVLLTLKIAGLFHSGATLVTGSVHVTAQEAPKEAAKEPKPKADEAKGSDAPAQNKQSKEEVKGAEDPQTGPQKNEAKANASSGPQLDGKKKSLNPSKNDVSGSELAILQSLGKRRIELDKREKELELRHLMLQAAQKQVEARVKELKKIEENILSNIEQKNEQQKKEFLDLVAMYNKMKPKKAAAIFEGLQEKVLVSIVKKMKPANVAKIIGAMNPQKAQELTHQMTQSIKPKMVGNLRERSLPQVPSEAKAVQ